MNLIRGRTAPGFLLAGGYVENLLDSAGAARMPGAVDFLTYATATVLQAVANGHTYGFDIIDATGLPGGTVYPALRRLEHAGYLDARWEPIKIAKVEPRPPRRYYALTRAGEAALAEAVRRYRLLEHNRPARSRARLPRPSRA